MNYFINKLTNKLLICIPFVFLYDSQLSIQWLLPTLSVKTKSKQEVAHRWWEPVKNWKEIYTCCVLAITWPFFPVYAIWKIPLSFIYKKWHICLLFSQILVHESFRNLTVSLHVQYSLDFWGLNYQNMSQQIYFDDWTKILV